MTSFKKIKLSPNGVIPLPQVTSSALTDPTARKVVQLETELKNILNSAQDDFQKIERYHEVLRKYLEQYEHMKKNNKTPSVSQINKRLGHASLAHQTALRSCAQGRPTVVRLADAASGAVPSRRKWLRLR